MAWSSSKSQTMPVPCSNQSEIRPFVDGFIHLLLLSTSPSVTLNHVPNTGNRVCSISGGLVQDYQSLCIFNFLKGRAQFYQCPNKQLHDSEQTTKPNICAALVIVIARWDLCAFSWNGSYTWSRIFKIPSVKTWAIQWYSGWNIKWWKSCWSNSSCLLNLKIEKVCVCCIY